MTISVGLRKSSISRSRTLTNSAIPTNAPAMNTAMYGMFRSLTAFIVGTYRPSAISRNEPDIPGSTSAQIATAAATNTSR